MASTDSLFDVHAGAPALVGLHVVHLGEDLSLSLGFVHALTHEHIHEEQLLLLRGAMALGGWLMTLNCESLCTADSSLWFLADLLLVPVLCLFLEFLHAPRLLGRDLV